MLVHVGAGFSHATIGAAEASPVDAAPRRAYWRHPLQVPRLPEVAIMSPVRQPGPSTWPV